jgi:hypothetical protein
MRTFNSPVQYHTTLQELDRPFALSNSDIKLPGSIQTY